MRKDRPRKELPSGKGCSSSRTKKKHVAFIIQGGKAAAADAHARGDVDEDEESVGGAEPNELSAEELMPLFVTFSSGPQPLSGSIASAVSDFNRGVLFALSSAGPTRWGTCVRQKRSLKKVTALGKHALKVIQLFDLKDATRSSV